MFKRSTSWTPRRPGGPGLLCTTGVVPGIISSVSEPSIADYALLADCRSAALVSRFGSVDWLCAPRFDGASVFGRLLDPAAGHWSLTPGGGAQISRRYLPETMVMETTFRVPTGTLRLVDAMLVGYGERGHDLGRGSPGVLVRQLTCLEGRVDVIHEFAPRPEYGLVHP